MKGSTGEVRPLNAAPRIPKPPVDVTRVPLPDGCALQVRYSPSFKRVTFEFLDDPANGEDARGYDSHEDALSAVVDGFGYAEPKAGEWAAEAEQMAREALIRQGFVREDSNFGGSEDIRDARTGASACGPSESPFNSKCKLDPFKAASRDAEGETNTGGLDACPSATGNQLITDSRSEARDCPSLWERFSGRMVKDVYESMPLVPFTFSEAEETKGIAAGKLSPGHFIRPLGNRIKAGLSTLHVYKNTWTRRLFGGDGFNVRAVATSLAVFLGSSLIIGILWAINPLLALGVALVSGVPILAALLGGSLCISGEQGRGEPFEELPASLPTEEQPTPRAIQWKRFSSR